MQVEFPGSALKAAADAAAAAYKLVYQEDDRYTYTLPKSGSDHRGSLNAANDIGRLMF